MDALTALSPATSSPAGTVSPSARTADGIGDPAEGFEAIFLRQLLRDLRKTATVDGESSHTTGFYTDMFDDFLAQHLAATGGIGLAGAIRTYLERSGR